MKLSNFRQPLWQRITQNVYFPVLGGIFIGCFCADLYEAFTGKDFFNVWHDRFFGIICVWVGFHALFSSRKKGFTGFLVDTLGGLGLIGTGVYVIFS